jgi:hypothetical protein
VGGTISVKSLSAYEILPYVDSEQVRLTLAVSLTSSTQKEDGSNLLKLLFEIHNDSAVPITGAVVTEAEYFKSVVNEYPTLTTGATTFEKEFIVPAGTRSLTFVMTALDPSQTQYSTAPMTLDLSPLMAPKATNPPAIRPGKTVDTTGTIYDTDRYTRFIRYAALIAFALTLDDGSKELWTLYKGKFSEHAQTGHTDSDSMTYQHPTIEGTFVRREYDNALGAVAATADENVMATVEAGWFEQVYEAVNP